MQTVILQEFKKFGEDTTIRGVPRIFKSSSRLVRILWSLTVLASLSILLWQLSELFQSYLKYQVDSIYKEARGRPLFPDVTICNLNQLAYSDVFNMSYDLYLQMTSKRKLMYSYSETSKLLNLTESEYDSIWDIIESSDGYFASVLVTDIAFSAVVNETVNKKKYSPWKLSADEVPAGVKAIWTPNYGICYTIYPKKDQKVKFEIKQLFSILYLNNFPRVFHFNEDYEDYMYLAPTEVVGIRVSIHSPGTYPNLEIGMDIGPGTKTSLHISNTVRIRQPQPYGNCTKQKYLDGPHISDETEAELYTKDACFDVCMQRSFVEKCGCVTNLLRFTRHQFSLVNESICGNQSLLLEEDGSNITGINGFKQLLCVYQTSEQIDIDLCEDECVDRCEENEYDAKVSSVPWPHVSSQLSFYDEVIAGKVKYSDRFDEYRNISNSDLSIEEKINELKKIHLLEENFIKLDITFDKSSPMILKETPSFPPVKMLSLTGGILSLWLGFTVVNAVEIVHLVISVVVALYKHLRKRQNKTI